MLQQAESLFMAALHGQIEHKKYFEKKKAKA
jgi:hypothetical protein